VLCAGGGQVRIRNPNPGTMVRSWIAFLVGAAALAALHQHAVRVEAPGIEARIQERVERVFEAVDFPWVEVTVDGRDVTLQGMAPTGEQQYRARILASRVHGVRVVQDQTTTAPSSAPPEDPA